jgi:hypothetical protein
VEDGRHQLERSGGNKGAAKTLTGAGDDENQLVDGKASSKRRYAEKCDTGNEHAPTAKTSAARPPRRRKPPKVSA